MNLNGEVVGINTAIIQNAQGIGFAIPINTARAIAEELIAHGKILRLGILGGTIDEVFAARYERNTGKSLPVKSGVFVVEVVPNEPAAAAGLQPGDLIFAVGGDRIRSMEELTAKVREAGHGGELAIDFYRGEERFVTTARL